MLPILPIHCICLLARMFDQLDETFPSLHVHTFDSSQDFVQCQYLLDGVHWKSWTPIFRYGCGIVQHCFIMR